MTTKVKDIVKKIDFPYPPFWYQEHEIDRRIICDIEHTNLFWDMGAGKTYGSTLLAMCYHDMTGSITLQLVPPILLKQWKKWLDACGIKSVIYAGLPKERARINLKDPNLKYVLLTAAILKNDFNRIEEDLRSTGRKIMVSVDEATAIKNHESGNFRAVLQMQYGGGIMPMTGSPLSTPADAYAYMKLVSPDLYRSNKHFESIHVAARDFYDRPIEWKNMDLLRENFALNSSFISTPEVHPDMPRANVQPVIYDLAKPHKKLYEMLVDQSMLTYEDGTVIDATTPNKMYHKIQQIVINYGYFANNLELKTNGFELLDDYLTELVKKKLVVFANYKMSVRTIVEYLRGKGYKCGQINGDCTPKEIQDAKDAFLEDPGCQVLVMNPRSGGVGVDGLQHVCNHMLFLEIPTIAKDFWQAVKRLERPGQKFVVDCRVATAGGTVQVTLNNQLVDNDGLVNEVVPSVTSLRAALLGR